MFIATEEYQRYRGSKIYFENILDWDGNWDDHKETDEMKPSKYKHSWVRKWWDWFYNNPDKVDQCTLFII